MWFNVHSLRASRCIVLLAMAAFSLTFAGCQSFSFNDVTVHGGGASGGGAPEVVGSFETTKISSWLLWGIVPFSGAAGTDSEWVRQMVLPELRAQEGDAAVNVSIRSGKFFRVDTIAALVLSGMTGFVWSGRTFTISGDVVRYAEE